MARAHHNPSRRRFLRTGAAATAGILMAGCGADLTDLAASAVNPPPTSDLAGAQLTAVLRRGFIPELSTQLADLGHTWASENNAFITIDFADDWRERAERAAQLGRGHDIAELFSNGAHALKDHLVDVGSVAEQLAYEHGGWSAAARSSAMVDGVWLAVPWAYTAHAINGRADILDAAGADEPLTYDDLLEAAYLLHEAGLPQAGFTMGTDGPNDSASLAYSMLWAFGGHEVDESGRVALDTAETRAAIDYWVQLHAVSDPRAAGYTEGGNNDAFLAGAIALTQNASSIYWRARNEGLPIADSIVHLPYPSGPAGRHQLVEINLLGIFDHSPNLDAALSWIRWACQPDAMTERAITSLSYYSPPLGDFESDPTMPWNADPIHRGLSAHGDTGHIPGWPGPAGVESALVYENATIVKMFAAAADGLSTDSVVRTATHELERIYRT